MIRINLLSAERATKKKAVTLQTGQKMTIGCSVILVLAVLFVATGFVFFVVRGLDYAFKKLDLEKASQGEPSTQVEEGRRLPPEPRLQGAPGNGDTPTELPLEAMATLRKETAAKLTSYGWVDKPGQITHIRDVNMDFRYGTSFGVQLAEAYERLLLDCILGDSTLYARKDMTERGWEIVMPILDYWAATKTEGSFPNYEAGSWGPPEADELMERDGRRWRRI